MKVSDTAIVILTDTDGNAFRASLDQANAIKELESANKGGFASVIGYRPSSGYTVSPVIDYQVLTRFSYLRLLERKMDAIEAIAWADVAEAAMAQDKIKALGEAAARALFNERKQGILASASKTLMGERDDSRRQAHDRCYGRVTEGVRVHYATQKVDGVSMPILTDGLPTADSIMLNALVINKTTRQQGERKAVNSGAPVLMSNIIERLLNQRSVGFKALSLKPGNFETVKLGGVVLNEADTARLGDILI